MEPRPEPEGIKTPRGRNHHVPRRRMEPRPEPEGIKTMTTAIISPSHKMEPRPEPEGINPGPKITVRSSSWAPAGGVASGPPGARSGRGEEPHGRQRARSSQALAATTPERPPRGDGWSEDDGDDRRDRTR